MSRPRHEMPDAEPNDLAALFNYPALGRLYDDASGAELSAMRNRLSATIATLERVVRQGTRDDAARATRVVRAYQTTLKFLEDLERFGAESQTR